MRYAPPIGSMPSITTAANMIQKSLNINNKRLGTLSINQLFYDLHFKGPVWITGSTVWLQAAFGVLPDPDGDFDIVFQHAEDCNLWVKKTLEILNRHIPTNRFQFTLVVTAFGSHRILDPDGKGIIDAWSLHDESIAELITSFPGGPHVRCAYLIDTKSTSTSANLLRLIKEPPFSNGDLVTALCLSHEVSMNLTDIKQHDDSYPKQKTVASIFTGIKKKVACYPNNVGDVIHNRNCSEKCGTEITHTKYGEPIDPSIEDLSFFKTKLANSLKMPSELSLGYNRILTSKLTPAKTLDQILDEMSLGKKE